MRMRRASGALVPRASGAFVPRASGAFVPRASGAFVPRASGATPHKRNDLRHRLVMLRRDLRPDIQPVQRPRQRWVRDQRHAGCLGRGADARGQLIHALRYHLGRGITAQIGQRDGVMGGVGYDDRRLGHRRHHPLPRTAFPDLATTGAHMGIAVALLHLVPQFLPRHPQHLQVPRMHPHQVEHRDRREGRQGRAGQPQRSGRGLPQHRAGRRMQRRLQGRRIAEREPQGPTHQAEFQHAADEFGEPIRAEQPLQTAPGIDLAELRRQRLRRDQPPRLYQRRRHRAQRHRAGDRHDQQRGK